VPRRASLFRQRDLTRALKATQAAGVKIARVEVDHGKLVIVPAQDRDDTAVIKPQANEWDIVGTKDGAY
jgi:hypothetical protein